MPATPKDPIPPALRWQVWERDDFRCHYCGARRNLAVDHKVPESRGGAMVLDNLVTACGPCNSRKSTKPYEDFLFEKELDWAFAHIIEQEGGFADSKEFRTRLYQLATVRYFAKRQPGWFNIMRRDPETGKSQEYWRSVDSMSAHDFAEYIAWRRERGLNREADHLTRLAVERFGEEIRQTLPLLD